MEHSAHRIPLKGSVAGIQYAGWTPSVVADEGLGSRTLPEQFIPVDGGAELHADVYVPAAEGRYPAVVCFAAYSTEGHAAGLPTGTNEIGSPPVFTDRGYCPVIVERRGMAARRGRRSSSSTRRTSTITSGSSRGRPSSRGATATSCSSVPRITA